MKAIALIPARYGSSRFPGKPLAKLGGKELILRVCSQVEKSGILPVVATDDDRILKCVEAGGYQAVMTSSDHQSGTDRIREALDLIEYNGVDVILNVQGDEPFIQPEQLTSLLKEFSDPKVKIATLVRPFDPSEGFEALFSPNLVKVTRRANGDALYFSRSIIPYVRGVEWEEWLVNAKFHTHIGVYAYRPRVLKDITALPQSPLEKAESLEQLRWLENGYNIRTVITSGFGVGIDTPEDLTEAERLLSLL